MAHATLETSQLAYAVAALNGLYKKYGLDVELLFTEGDGKTLQTLVAGGADVSTQGISTALSSQVTDVPLAVISMTATTLTDAIVSSPDVKTKEDLRGKSVAISTFGSTAHAAAVLALQSMGMTPNDVNIVQVGGQASRIAALKGGSVAGAVVDVAQEDEMKAQGFNILTRLPDTPLEFGRNGLLVRRDWLSQYPNTLLALTAGTLEGQNMIWNDTPKAVESFMKWAQITDRARAESEIEFFKKYGNRDMRWTKEGWERARDILAFSNPEVKDVDVEKAYTFQFLDRVREAGLNDQLGVPARR
jgi:NitT/TauT family transport system substrate-binding protein